MDERDKARVLRRARMRARAHRRARVYVVRSDLVATTDTLPGCDVVEHLGVVTAEVVTAADFLSDFAVDVRDLVGGRSGTLEKVLRGAREDCLEQLRAAAHKAGGHALVGVRVSIDAPTKSVLIVSAIGSAVRVARPGQSGEVPAEELAVESNDNDQVAELTDDDQAAEPPALDGDAVDDAPM